MTLTAAVLMLLPSAWAGTWTNLLNPPPSTIRNMLLLTDGTIFCENATTSSNWFKLTPDSHGSYINGTWTTNLAPMHYSRVFFASQVLQNGKVIVAGGENGNGTNTSELYDPQSNTWTQVTIPAGLSQNILDAESVLLPNGTVMMAPVYPGTNNQTLIYNPVANTWTAGPIALRGQDEESWVKLPDDSILTVDL